MSTYMLRTTVYIDESTESELRRISKKEGRPKAELIREALVDYVAKARARREVSLPPGVGRHASSRGDVSARSDELLWNGDGGRG